MLILTGNGSLATDEKSERIEFVAGMIIEELMNQGITSAICGDLSKHALSVNDYVSDGDLRNMNILSGV